jgi:hypothetical protein
MAIDHRCDEQSVRQRATVLADERVDARAVGVSAAWVVASLGPHGEVIRGSRGRPVDGPVILDAPVIRDAPVIKVAIRSKFDQNATLIKPFNRPSQAPDRRTSQLRILDRNMQAGSPSLMRGFSRGV